MVTEAPPCPAYAKLPPEAEAVDVVFQVPA